MLDIQLDDRISPRLRQVLSVELAAARAQMTCELLDNALQRTRERNPVATGRSRAGWDAAQQQATIVTSPSSTDAQATNTVPYIAHLEYGTSRLRPVAMLRRALAEARHRAAKLFKLH